MFLLMALEAARQLQTASDSSASSLVISHFEIVRLLRLDSIPESENGLEVKLMTNGETTQGPFDFVITSLEASKTDQWREYCIGTFEWSQDMVEATRIGAWNSAQEPLMLPLWRVHDDTTPSTLRQLKVFSKGYRGKFEQALYPHENYPIDPRVLSDILTKATIALNGSDAPLAYRLVSITSITNPIPFKPSEVGEFAMDVKAEGEYSIRCDLDIRQGDQSILLKGLRYRATKLAHREPALRSLFFKARTMHDITRLYRFNETTSFSRVAELIYHRWPMSDIRIQDLDDKFTKEVQDAFGVSRKDKRPLFRSLTIKGTRSEPASDRVRYVEAFETSEKCHVFFTGDCENLTNIYDQLYPKGLVCIPNSSARTGNIPRNPFRIVGSTSSMRQSRQSRWKVWRKESSLKWHDGRRTTVFGSRPLDQSIRRSLFSRMTFYDIQENFGSDPLVEQDILRYCQSSPPGGFDAIVLDFGERSIITTCSGDVLMPWLQMLLKHADSILWVTDDRFPGPFNKVAGTLLRTLQSERPSLKVKWLMAHNKDSGGMDDLFFAAYISLIEGDNEIKDQIVNNQPTVLRYYPDDELAAATGTIPPRTFESPMSGKNYTLSFAAPTEPVIWSSRSEPQAPIAKEVDIKIQASVIDPNDVLAFSYYCRDPFPGQCKFFAGCIISNNGAFSSGEQVVGYTAGSHQNALRVPEIQVFSRPQHPPSPEAACEFAAVAVASCIVDGVARVREGDVLALQVNGILKVALHQLITEAQATVSDGEKSPKANFTVTYSIDVGILVNDRPFELLEYLQSPRGRNFVEQAWRSRRLLSCPLEEFELPDYAKAFKKTSTHEHPYSTAIHHGTDEQTVSHVPIYKPPTSLFSSTGLYVLIGGLGGLGRFICTWMVEHGARNLVAISRSGLSNPEARETQTAISKLGASLQVFQGDACDRTATRSILSTLRQTAPIKGVINLAMVLGDAPMASMTGEEWDRALRVKIDSSWILHEETLDDPLDFFILFSSIASVCGNRNQGNYNVGNTFLNALAEYRQSIDRPGISIALGAMSKCLFFLDLTSSSAAAGCIPPPNFPFFPPSFHFAHSADIPTPADMGVLYSLSKANMLDILTRSGLSHLTKTHLAKIMEAAIFESHRRDRSLIVTGLEMFERDVEGKLKGRTEPLYWAEL